MANKSTDSKFGDSKKEQEKIALPKVKVAVYDENEDTTCVDSALLLTRNSFKRCFLVPLLSLLSLFVFPLFIYWRKSLQRDWLYSRAASLETATHIYIKGRGKLTYLSVQKSLTLMHRWKHRVCETIGLIKSIEPFNSYCQGSRLLDRGIDLVLHLSFHQLRVEARSRVIRACSI